MHTFRGVLSLNQVVVFRQRSCTDLRGLKNLEEYKWVTRRSEGRYTNVCVLHVEFLLLKFFVVFVVVLQSPCVIVAVTKDLVNLIQSANPVCQEFQRREG